MSGSGAHNGAGIDIWGIAILDLGSVRIGKDVGLVTLSGQSVAARGVGADNLVVGSSVWGGAGGDLSSLIADGGSTVGSNIAIGDSPCGEASGDESIVGVVRGNFSGGFSSDGVVTIGVSSGLGGEEITVGVVGLQAGVCSNGANILVVVVGILGSAG